MPNWMPNRNNVRWDWGAAREAATALRHAADVIERTAHERERAANEAKAEWRGRYREQFDGELANILRRARELAHEYREAANRIDRASSAAWDEQQRREAERERWQREKEREEREDD